MSSLAKNKLDEYMLYDRILFLTVLLVLVFGSIMVMSAGSFIAAEKFGNENFFIKNQIKNVLIGVVAFVFAMNLNYRKFNNKLLMYIGMGVTLLALIYLLISNMGDSVKGAKRWIFGFQPSEIAKVYIVFFLAFSLNERQKFLTDIKKGYLFHLLILCVFVGLVFLQPAFSTSMMIFLIGYSMFYISGMKMKHLLSSLTVIIPAIIVIAILQPYRMERIKTFINPSDDISGKGWQVEQSLRGFGNGYFVGSGFGESRLKEFYLPEPHNDFIYSIIGDELGFVGTTLLLLAYVIIMIRGFSIAKNAPDYYGFVLACGITITVIMYSVFNMMITLGMVPPTGLPLPLVSYGGTSLILTMFSFGVLLNISYQTKLGSGLKKGEIK